MKREWEARVEGEWDRRRGIKSGVKIDIGNGWDSGGNHSGAVAVVSWEWWLEFLVVSGDMRWRRRKVVRIWVNEGEPLMVGYLVVLAAANFTLVLPKLVFFK